MCVCEREEKSKREEERERESCRDRGGPQYLYRPLGGAGAWLREGKSERMREEKEGNKRVGRPF